MHTRKTRLWLMAPWNGQPGPCPPPGTPIQNGSAVFEAGPSGSYPSESKPVSLQAELAQPVSGRYELGFVGNLQG